MKSLSCRSVRRDLAAYRDGELTLDRQLAVRAHLAMCADCVAEAVSIEHVGGLLRHASASRVDSMGETLASVHARVVAGVQADPPQRLGRRAARALDDRGHWLWIVAGATAASIVCLLSVLGVMRLSQREVPHSMAAILEAMADPGSNRNPMVIDERLLLPRVYPAEIMPAALAERDAVFALSAVVTREGHVQNLELLMPGSMRAWEAEQVLEVLDLAAQTRFEPARSGQTPVAVNVVWLLAHTTVVGKEREMQIGPAIRRLRAVPVSPRTSVPMSAVDPPSGETAA
jgi:hypothetical protein